MSLFVHPWIRETDRNQQTVWSRRIYHQSCKSKFRCGKAAWHKKRLIDRGFEVVEHMTERIGHGAELAHQVRTEIEASSEAPSLVVAVGGDGIVHGVASGLRGSSIPLGRSHLVPKRLLHYPWNSTKPQRCIGHSRGWCGSKLWGLARVLTPTLDGYPAHLPTTGWRCKDDGRTVRWVFLESDTGITSAISRAKLRRQNGSRSKYTYLGVTTIPFWPRRKVEVTLDDGNQRFTI